MPPGERLLRAFSGRSRAFPLRRAPDDSVDKTLMLGEIEGRRSRGRQGMRWLTRLNGHEFEQAPGVVNGQGGLACCGPRGRKESDTTEPLESRHSFGGDCWVRLWCQPGGGLLDPKVHAANGCHIPLLSCRRRRWRVPAGARRLR